MNFESWIEKNKKILLLLIISTLIYSSFYYVYPARPGINFAMGIESSPGWEAWHDQGEYYKMSNLIANGSFNSENFSYGLGYPILAVPFVLMGSDDSVFSHHRFFVPNLIMFLAVVYVTYNLTLRLTTSYKISILSLAFLFFLTLYLSWFIEPWNIHVADVGVLGIFYIFFRKFDDIPRKHLIISGLLAGWIFSARYLDIFWLLPIFIIFLVFNVRKIIYFIPGIFLIGLVLFSHLIYFDDPLQLPNVYRSVAFGTSNPIWEKVGFNTYDWDPKIISTRIYCILFDPQFCLPDKIEDEFVDNWWFYALVNKTPIIASTSAFLILSPLGIYVLFRRSTNQEKWILFALIIGFLVSIISYSASAMFTSGWTRFFRYEIFWFPLFTIFSVYGMAFLYYKTKSKKIESM